MTDHLTIHAMGAMIVGQKFAGWRTDKPSLVALLTRAGFTAGEVVEHLDDAMREAGVLGEDPIVVAMRESRLGDKAYSDRANAADAAARRLTPQEDRALAAETYEVPWQRIASGSVEPASLPGAIGAAIWAADMIDAEPEFATGLLRSAVRFLEPRYRIRDALDEAMVETIERQREHAEEARA